jgi:hypothetical protein
VFAQVGAKPTQPSKGIYVQSHGGRVAAVHLDPDGIFPGAKRVVVVGLGRAGEFEAVHTPGQYANA